MPFAMQAFEKGLEFNIDVSKVTINHLIGDKTRIRQITNNILSNALKFTEKGEISITLQAHQAQNSVMVLCEVKDTGIGIDKCNQAKMFGSFNQEDTNITKKYGGTGLGLAICKQLAQLMQGDVFFRSEKNKGSSFYYAIELEMNPQEFNSKNLLNKMFVQIYCTEAKQANLIKNDLKLLGASAECIDELRDFNKRANLLIIDADSNNESSTDYTNFPEDLKIIELVHPNDKRNLTSKHKVDYLLKPFTLTYFVNLLYGNERLSQFICEQEATVFNRASEGIVSNDSEQAIIANRVLIVDDNNINIEIIKGMLSKHVAATFSATNGSEALQILKRTSKTNSLFDLVLLDCNMPIMDGLECAKRIRSGLAGTQNTEIPIIAITADAMLGDQEKCIKAGMNAYLTKPINSNALLILIKKWARQISGEQRENTNIIAK